MHVCRTIDQIRALIPLLRKDGYLGLVPTMGALHAGHLALVKAAAVENGHTIATIFVNPAQFGNASDLENYPRTEEADLLALKAAGVSAVFIPMAEEIYPDGNQTIVETTELANMLHGLVRPGHFCGVTTVVTKLFNIIGPDNAYFGQKDYQQLAVIKRMVQDLHMPISIKGVATVRESDGLAMSSRNVRLTKEHRAAAPILNQTLIKAADMLKSGMSVEKTILFVKETVAAEPLAKLQAIDIVEAKSFKSVSGMPSGKLGMMISALFGEVLLIDQQEVAL